MVAPDDTARTGARSGQNLGVSASVTRAMFTPRQLAVWLGLCALSLIWLLPVRLRDALACGIGKAHYRYARRHFRAGRRNLRACFPAMSAAEIDALLQEHSMTQWCVWLDLPAFWMSSNGRRGARTVFEGLEILQARAKAEQPTVLLVCHNAALEHAAHALKGVLPVVGYYKPFKSPVLEWLFLRLRKRGDSVMIGRDTPLHGLIKAVRGGRQLYQMIDEDLGVPAGEFASFFSTELCTVIGTGRICRVAGAAAFPVFSGYDRAERCYRVRVLPPLDDFPAAARRDIAQQTAQCLEALIEVDRSQFMWCQRMLHTRRDGAESVYAGIRTSAD